jgi:predicted PhzF superfamily epimerase YddE/YHI9
VLNNIFLVDAFVGKRERGNPAGVCLLDAPARKEWMQELAEEMAQAETAFVCKVDGQWQLRWFTPVCEVDLCGHATLASAKVLFSNGLADDEVRFQTKSGELICRSDGDRISLDFPSAPAESCSTPYPLARVASGSSWFGVSPRDYFAVLHSQRMVEEFEPDLEAIEAAGMRGLIITAPGEETDFCSRFFAPQSGVPEDHFTGSAHCTLAPYWAGKFGKTHLSAVQLSSRGGFAEVGLDEDRVVLKGAARIRLGGVLGE